VTRFLRERIAYPTRKLSQRDGLTMHKLTIASLGLLLLSVFAVRPAAAQNGSPLQVTHAKRFQFVADYRFTQSKQVGAELESLAQQLWSELMIPDKRTPVRVYLFSTQNAFSVYVRKHIPSLTQADTNRTAMFLLRNDTPYIFAVATPELILNLRHEFVHVLLNTSHENLPIWLDEGLAEYYELKDGEQQEFRKLLARQNRLFWRPGIGRLERLKTMSQMGLVEYAEGWSWVHLLMEGSKASRRVIPEYLSNLRKGALSPSISDRVAATGMDARSSWNRQYRTSRRRFATRPASGAAK
jgi:hypothetical protein